MDKRIALNNETSIRPFGPINDGFNSKKNEKKDAVDLINERQRHLIFLMKCAYTRLEDKDYYNGK